MLPQINPDDQTPFVKLMIQRYHHIAHPADGSEATYEDFASYLSIVNGPRAYGIEDEMLEYALSHEDATMQELTAYFDILAENREPVEDPDDEGNEWLDE